MKKISKKLYSATALTLISRSILANENNESSQQTTKHDQVISTEIGPQKGWKLDHVELAGIFLPTVWVLGFLVVIFIILKYFIYLPDEKRKDVE